MKLTRLASTTQRISQEAKERVRQASDENSRRVESLEGVEGDRQRTLQQELAEVEPAVIGEFRGNEKIQAEVKAAAEQLLALGNHLGDLIKTDRLVQDGKLIDDQA